MFILPSLTQQVTKNFVWNELYHIEDASSINEQVLGALHNLAWFVLQPIRDRVGVIKVTSAFRSPEHNSRVGGAPWSQHLYGEAADIVAAACSPAELGEVAREVGAYKVIVYDRHVHVSIPSHDFAHHATQYFARGSYRSRPRQHVEGDVT